MALFDLTPYASHGIPGYPYHDFQEVYDQLYLILDGARCAGKQIVLGGNLNTKLHVGIRGEAVTIFSYFFYQF